MAQTTFIDLADWIQEQVLARDADAAVTEMRQCITAFNRSLESLARAFPGVVAIGSIVAGRSCGSLVLAGSGEGDVCHTTALNAMRALGQIVGRMSPELRAGFQLEFDLALEKEKLLAETEQARSIALAAAAEKRSE